jgi:hypothetical protein
MHTYAVTDCSTYISSRSNNYGHSSSGSIVLVTCLLAVACSSSNSISSSRYMQHDVYVHLLAVDGLRLVH